MEDLKQLVIIQSKRVIELLENGCLTRDRWGYVPDRAELKTKMAELRRDTMRLEKKLYGRTNNDN